MYPFIYVVSILFAMWVFYAISKLLGIFGTAILFTLPIFFTYIIIKFSDSKNGSVE